MPKHIDFLGSSSLGKKRPQFDKCVENTPAITQSAPVRPRTAPGNLGQCPGKLDKSTKFLAPSQAHVCGRASVEFVFHIFFVEKLNPCLLKFHISNFHTWRCGNANSSIANISVYHFERYVFRMCH